MIVDVPTLIAFLTADTTLLPGTVILTGTPPKLPPPADVGPLPPGDEITVEIDRIGRLVNPVTAATGPAAADDRAT
jgi:2-keto-4-pentenoate hydratase/2-oxohepta-3-ene-1,7-dioic acid hydratase in catechol pathway